MIKTILIPVGAAGIGTPAFDAALWVARLFNSHLDFLYARQESFPVAAEMGALYGGLMVPGILDQLQAAFEQHESQLLAAYHQMCDRHRIVPDVVGPVESGVSACWHRETRHEERQVAAYGRTSDLLVVSRPTLPLTAQVIEAALLDTGRPVLIPGSKPPSLETVAIAWKPTREAARAVSAALPFLLRAKRLIVINAAERGEIDQAGTQRLVTTLRAHRCEVEPCHLESGSPDMGESLLVKAQQTGAGLVVMGAYGHGRARELVFGGVTERVLKASDLPILMAH